MPSLKWRNSPTDPFTTLAIVAKGDKGDKGDDGDPGPPGDAGPLEGLSDVSNAVDTPVGKMLGTVATGDWQPVDIPTGDVTEAPIDGNQYARKDAGWEQLSIDLSAYLPLSGGTLTGTLNLVDGEAADKPYVDSRIWQGTQAQYDALGSYDPTILYVVTG